MNDVFRYFWRHPRRTGFIVFNVIAIGLFVAWGAFTDRMSHDGVAGIPNVMLGYTGMLLLVVVLIGGWTAWGVMVMRRHGRSHDRTRDARS